MVALIVDHFKFESQKPFGKVIQNLVCYSYKKYSVNYLIEITPQVSIIYISETFSVKESNKIYNWKYKFVQIQLLLKNIPYMSNPKGQNLGAIF